MRNPRCHGNASPCHRIRPLPLSFVARRVRDSEFLVTKKLNCSAVVMIQTWTEGCKMSISSLAWARIFLWSSWELGTTSWQNFEFCIIVYGQWLFIQFNQRYQLKPGNLITIITELEGGYLILCMAALFILLFWECRSFVSFDFLFEW